MGVNVCANLGVEVSKKNVSPINSQNSGPKESKKKKKKKESQPY